MADASTDRNGRIADGRIPLSSLTLEGLTDALVKAGFQKFRAVQVLNWFYRKNAHSFGEMTNISTPVATWLDAHIAVLSSRLVTAYDAGDGAVKLEIALDDGLSIEAVLIEAPRRITLCVSSQVGCPLNCAFCATGRGGFKRNLTPWEIVEQALHASKLLTRRERISHIVFMGMGEPCLNLDAVFDSIRRFNSPYSFHVGARRMIISTLGSPQCIEKIAGFPLEVGLAVSLHAADDPTREKLIPAAPASVFETVEAAWVYFKKTGREVTYEYVLLEGVNDSPQDAEKLATLLAGKRAYVNIIPYNEVEGSPFKRPSPRKAAGFQRSLTSRGIKARVRKSLGRGVHAACGQLRLSNSAGRLP
ncbi:MAG: dual-specificity RNA methyltransferase RlmN [Planctomycetota bacterium]